MATPGRTQSYDTYGSPVRSPAASQYPFPVIDSPQRQQSFSRFPPPPRRGSVTPSIVSNDGRESIPESGQNAISTLLQPPIIRTGLQPHSAVVGSGYKAPTQKDIPPVALTNIPHVEAKAFHPYLAQVGSLYEAFQRAKLETDDGDAALFSRDKKEKEEDWEAVLSRKLQRPPHSRQGSTGSSVTSPIDAPQFRRRSSGQKRHTVTPLSTIPVVYTEEDFHLENPRTFDVVSERSEIIRDPTATPSGRKSLATNAILQEKLSWYMDTVEIHLVSSISTASKSFFSALGSLRELHAEAEDSVIRIQKLRKELAKLDKEMAVDGLKVINLKQRRDNIRRLAEAILQLEEIATSVQQCEQMVASGEIDGSLDEIDEVERSIAGDVPSEKYHPQDLRRLKALEGASDDLNHLRVRVGRGYEIRFHNSLLGDIRRHVLENQASVTLERWGMAFNRAKPGQRRAPSAFPSYMNVVSEFRAELEKEMHGLSRARHTTPAVTTFRTIILKEMKTMIRKQLPSATDDDNMSTVSASTYGGRGLSTQEKSSILSRNIKALDSDDWYQMLIRMYTNISESLRRLSVQVKILLDITSAMDRPPSGVKSPPPRTPNAAEKTLTPQQGRPRSVSIQVEIQQALDLSNLLGDAVDTAQNQIIKILRVRSQQVNDLSMPDFINYFTLNRLFADEGEAISGRNGVGLKSLVDGQIKEYLTQFGNSQRQKLVEVMDADKWDAKDFGDKENAVLKRLIDASTSDAMAWVESAMIWQKSSSTIDSNGTVPNGTSGGKEKVRGAVIDEQKYILSESPIRLLDAVEQCEFLATGIPGIGQEVAAMVLECLKLYNSRTNQLILGAGATRSAGLKNITTKHLALSSQGLSFVISLVPYIREYFRRHVPASSAMQSMTDFDKVKRLCQEHQYAIHEKLVDIMSSRCSMHVKAMKNIDWEQAARNKDIAVSPYMETLTKETATLQKVLAKHLPEGIVMSIMIPVFDSYKQQWEAAYNEIELRSSSAHERFLADAQYFDAKISKLDGAGDLGTHIVKLVRTKTISKPANQLEEPSTVMPATGRSSSEGATDSAKGAAADNGAKRDE